jgi:tetratricopeptide (TPR) repeat protein
MNAPDDFLSQARAHYTGGDLAAAETAYRAALALAPGRPSILHNLAVVVATRGRHAEALALFDQALAADPVYASAHYNRGVALEKLDRPREAIASLSRAVAIEPGHYDAHRALGFLWLGEGNRDRALDHYARTYELRRGDDRDGSALASLVYASRSKLQHDAAQLRHVAKTKRDGKRFELLARAYDVVARDFPEPITRLDDSQLDMLGHDYNAVIVLGSAPEVTGGTINPALDAAGISANFREHDCAATWFDGLLAPAALASLQRYLLESTIWHDFSHIGGFVASYLEDGLACPLVLQIADDLRRALPEILGPHPLTQAWAFKGLEGSSAVAAHADDAAVSVNFWVTPDAANLDPAAGGLRICRAPPPPGWEMSGYHADIAEILAFMQRHADASLVVPYGENRAAIFQSRLFHASDAPSFAPGYANHRINVTLLYGRATYAQIDTLPPPAHLI